MGKRAGELAHFMLLGQCRSRLRCRDRGEVHLCILTEVTHRSSSYSSPFGVSGRTSLVKRPTELTPRSIMMGETSITKKATNIKLHAQCSMERKARKVQI